ncbi:MAG: DUF1761 family protein [Alphaproteobacteria bacterium]|nr:DUF1761 family protein [Alphaproteobacteria bacterium]MBV9064092.1 DUF1761 family protein [Alphaproteobacteria bacterium]
MSGMIILAILAAGIAATFTDWLFMGVVFHDRYMRHPEVWREGIVGGKDRTAVLYSCALDFVAAAGIVGLCVLADINTLGAAVSVAVLAWIAGPLVIMVTNGFFMKLDWAVIGAHCAGYLVRFLLAAVAVAIFL